MPIWARQFLLMLVISAVAVAGLVDCADAKSPDPVTATGPCADMAMTAEMQAASQPSDHRDKEVPLPGAGDDCVKRCHGPAFAMVPPDLTGRSIAPVAWHAARLASFRGIEIAPAIPPPRTAREA